MQPQDVLRAAIDILKTRGWCQSDLSTLVAVHARGHDFQPVPLYRPDKSGESRAAINPAAASFSAYGSIVAALNESGSQLSGGPLMWDTLRRLASDRITGALGGQNHVHPLLHFNDAKGQTVDNVIELLNDAITEIDKVTMVDTMPTQPPIESIGLSAPMVQPAEPELKVVDDVISPPATHTGALAGPVVTPAAPKPGMIHPPGSMAAEAPRVTREVTPVTVGPSIDPRLPIVKPF